VTSHSVTLSGLLASTLYHYQVQSADSAGTLGGSADSTFTTATAAVSSCPCSIWASTTTPSTTTVNDDQAVELGVKFTASVSGYISGIRFYKGNSNTGTHTGTLWTSSGTRLATATFTGESSSGWQQVNFSTPVAIAASTTYVASYHTSVGYYSANSEYFSTSSVNQPPLQALASGTSGGDGVYVYGTGGVFPTSTYDATNYWVDVVFNTTVVGQTTYSISGTITGGSGATVTLSGAATATATADGSGNFSFNGVADGSYIITPSETGLAFSPVSQSVTVNNANVTGVAFTSTGQTYSISGTITGGSGATVTLSGAATATTTANGSGAFSFTGLANGAYTITPGKAGYTFSPSSQPVTVSNANVSGVSFAATALTYSISGTISGVGGATVTLSGQSSATTTADGSGNFSFSGLINGGYVITPTLTGYTFTPTIQSVTINGANVTGVSFTAAVAPTTYTISGNISPASVGSGATVTLSGAASASTTADSNGNFSFTSLSNGTYTITPTSSSATFSPTSQSATISNANATVSFTATATANVIFYDDFTGSTLSTEWVAMNRAGDYSNAEQECYNPSQITVANSNLVITTVAQTSTCGDSDHSPSQFPFLSGMVQWKTFNFTYGTLEFRAITAGGRGSWPAVWLLGYDCQVSNVNSADNVGACNWPNPGSDEIDVLEMSDNNYISVGHDMFVSSGGQACFQNASSDTSQNWHVYTMTWKAGSVTYAIDGTPAGCSHTQNVPTTPMFLIINNAISNGWQVVASDYPQTMQVDYVKVTQP
jgi:beta-glucanase (GH16 family)